MADFKIVGLPDGWLKVGSLGEAPIHISGWKPQEGETREPYDGEKEDVIFIPPGSFTITTESNPPWDVIWTGSTLMDATTKKVLGGTTS